MSLTVSDALLTKAQQNTLTQDDFITCVRESLPHAWNIVDGLAKKLEADTSLSYAVHAPEHMDNEPRGQLLRMLASSSMRNAIEQHFGLKFEFKNCHVTAAFKPVAVGGPEHTEFTSPIGQILAQSPWLLDC